MDSRLNDSEFCRNEFPTMPEYIKDMVEDTVKEQIEKTDERTKWKKRIWRGVSAACMLACVTAGTVVASNKLYHMYLQQQGEYGETVVFENNIENEDSAETRFVTVDMKYIPDGMSVDGLDDIGLDGTNKVSKVCVFFEEGDSRRDGVSFCFGVSSKKKIEVSEENVLSTKNMQIAGHEAVLLERNIIDHAADAVKYMLYVAYPEYNYLMTMWIDSDMDVDEALLIAENLELVGTNDVNAKHLILAEEYVEPTSDPAILVETDTSEVSHFVNDEMVCIHRVGDKFGVPKQLDGEDVLATVSKVEIYDNVNDLPTLNGYSFTDTLQKNGIAVNEDGSLMDNTIQYIKRGDGVSTLDKVIETKEVSEKLLYVEVTYSNTQETNISEMIIHCNYIWAEETDTGYEIVDPYAIDKDYDYYCGNHFSIGATACDYYNGISKDDRNYIVNFKAGTTQTVGYVFTISELELPYLFLDIASGNELPFLFDELALKKGYVDIRQ